MPNYRRYHLHGHTVFITIVTRNRNPWFKTLDSVELVLDSMRKVKSVCPYKHLAHVILPDHLHWMFTPSNGTNFSRIVAAMKREVTWRYKERNTESPKIWQMRFYDHLIRDEDDFARHLDYIHFNPVKHGYVSNPAAYVYSSFHSWLEKGAYPKDWGRADISRNVLDMNPE